MLTPGLVFSNNIAMSYAMPRYIRWPVYRHDAYDFLK